MTDEQGTSGAVLVVGGGISGLTAALETAEVGNDVFLVEKGPSFGGRVAQLNRVFPETVSTELWAWRSIFAG